MEQTVRNLKQKFSQGELDQASFEAKLLGLIDLASDGHYWMFGHRTERWYRHNGTHWVASHPSPEISNLPVEPNASNALLDWDNIFTSLLIILIIGLVVYYASTY